MSRFRFFHRKRMVRLRWAIPVITVVVTGVVVCGNSQRSRASEFVPTPLEARIIGQTRWLSGSNASLRIVANDHESGNPVGNAKVRVTIAKAAEGDKSPPKGETLFTGWTNAKGSVDASFDVPKWPKGNYQLTVNVSAHSLGTDTVSRNITLDSGTQILLTADKPLYQPGQTMHLRALALERPSLSAAAGKPLILEVEDSKGNKVMKKTQETSRFGIVGADFTLAYEVNMGRYTMRATLGDTMTEKKVTVERYVLPKFKVVVKPEKSFYTPGETLKGTAQCDYFFGKPVSRGRVTMRLATFDVGFNQFAELKGQTDENGTYKFETNLPDSFVGAPLEQGKALVKIETAVIDKAEHEEKATVTFPIAKQSIEIVAVPESGNIVPKLTNRIYILTSYPDGSPAKTNFTVRSGSLRAVKETDARGIGEISLTPETGEVHLTIRAGDDKGQTAEVTKSFAVEQKAESVLLRTDKAIYTVGDRMVVEAFTTARRGTVYLDIVRDRQTVLTKTLDISNGQGEAKLALDETLAGTLVVQAYRITRDGQIIRDRRIVYVNPANDLRISVSADKKTYLPQDQAKIHFSVSDSKGHPVLTALGVNIVDESIFGLQEMQPGMEKVYFTLEKELLEPKYEVHGFNPGEIVVPLPVEPIALRRGEVRVDPAQQQVARVLFAAASGEVEYSLDVNSYQEKAQKVAEAWQKATEQVAKKIAAALSEYAKRHFGKYPAPYDALRELVDRGLLKGSDVNDPLGRPYRIRPFNHENFAQGFEVWCLGLDGKPNTDDDARAHVYRQGRRGEKDDWTVGTMTRRWVRGQEREDMMAVQMAVPMASPPAGAPRTDAAAMKDGALAKGGEGYAAIREEEPVRVRQYFPETLYSNPAVITDGKGKASIDVTMADSITTWRLTTVASSILGAMGSTTAPLRVFQDFFIDIDLPVSLTQNDAVHIPVAVYNYLPKRQTVRLTMQKEDWFETSDDMEKKVEMNAGDVAVVYYPITVKKIGDHQLMVKAVGSEMSDAIQRRIEVAPDGQETLATLNDRLEGDVSKTITIPAGAIDDASNILVKIYPGTFSQVIEGLDKLLRMPSGCFEQTSSMTYPNILVTDYMKRTKKINPEIQMRAEQYINLGYQRLLTFEVKGGGFSWFGDAPAHKVLTAYGLMEFSDMSRVHEVDPALINRTQQWLAQQQKPDGSWEQDKGGIAEGIINRQTDVLRTSAYIAWALSDSGYKGAEVGKAVNFVGPKINSVDDAYVAAIIANLMVGFDPKDDRTAQALEKLVSMKIEKDKTAYWQSKNPTMTNGKDETADLETTGLAAYALLKSGRYAGLVNKVLTYLVQNKDAFGTWQTTQATVWSMKALTLATEKGTGETNAEISISINGKKAESFAITPEDSDVMRQVDLKQFVQEGKNEVDIKFSGKGSALYQISAKYFLPWPKMMGHEKVPLSIDVDYDRTELKVNDTVTCRVQVVNNQPTAANMVVVDLGIPPGFEVQTGDLAELVGSKVLKKFELTGRQAILYFERLEPGKPVAFGYRLKAKYPLRVKTPKSMVYEYYAPKIAAVANPVEVVVQ